MLKRRKPEKNIEHDSAILRIPDITKPPTADSVDDFTILELNSDYTRSRELDRITQMAREGVYRKNLLLLRKERNLLTAVQNEQLGNLEISITCYERAATLAERLELFEESKLYRDKVKILSKTKRKTDLSGKKRRRKRESNIYSRQDLSTKPILPKGVTIPIVDKQVAKQFKEARTGPEDEDEDLF